MIFFCLVERVDSSLTGRSFFMGRVGNGENVWGYGAGTEKIAETVTVLAWTGGDGNETAGTGRGRGRNFVPMQNSTLRPYGCCCCCYWWWWRRRSSLIFVLWMLIRFVVDRRRFEDDIYSLLPTAIIFLLIQRLSDQ